MIIEKLIDKHRPTSFLKIRGQRKVLGPLLKAIQAQSVPNRILFTGDQGTGKTTAGLCLAHAVNCFDYDSEKFQVCGKCESCRTSYYYLHHLNAKRDRLTEKFVQSMNRSMKIRPLIGKHRVYLIDEVHTWFRADQEMLNLFLDKFPNGSLLILTTYKPEDINHRIRSQFTEINMTCPQEVSLKKIVSDILRSEKKSLKPATIEKIVSRGFGNPRAVVNLVERELMKSVSMRKL